ncbi:hypothetical protein ACEPPN_014811 [Leptodophora sp. 'Broadleaf-Isolate-01']
MEQANARREDPEKAAYTLSVPSSEPPKPKPSKMSRFRHITCALLVVAVLAFTLTSAAANGGNGIARMSISAADRQRFQELLNSVDPKALHNVLHAAEGKYQHGIFTEDKAAMEVVHEENAEVATSLVELAKRQTGNSSTTTTDTTVVVVDPTTTPGTTSQTPTVDPTTSETSQAPPTTSPTNPPTVAPTPTTSENPTTPATQPSVEPTTQPTTAQTTAPTTTRAPATAAPTPSTSAGQSTNVRSSSTLATETSADDNPTTTSARSVTQQTIYTTTLANGAVQTVTQVTVVAGQADQTGGSSTRTSTAKGSLQTNAASIKNVGMNGLLGALGMVVVGAL